MASSEPRERKVVVGEKKKRKKKDYLIMITKDFYLPTEEELTVQEVNINTSSLRAVAFHLGKTCEAENNVCGCNIDV